MDERPDSRASSSMIIEVDDENENNNNIVKQINKMENNENLNIGVFAGAKYSSFAEFESCFEHWKREEYHPFRVAR